MTGTKTYEVHGIGRRKSSVARVYFFQGKGNIEVNGKNFEDYFARQGDRHLIKRPLEIAKGITGRDIKVVLHGGGLSGQAGACALGIARAIVKVDESLKPELRAAGLLTRDSRKVERKKYGKAGARKSFQFSKR